MLIAGFLGLRGNWFLQGGNPLGVEPAQAQNKCRPLPLLGSRPDLALMRLHNLVHNGEP